MKKLLPALLLILGLFLIGPPQADSWDYLRFLYQWKAGFGSGSGGETDNCSGSLAYSHHMENDKDATKTANGETGCSDSETYKSLSLSSATFSNTFYGDGGYSLYMNGYQHRAAIDNTGTWIDISDEGSIEFWWHDHTDDSDIESCYALYFTGGDGSLLRVRVYNNSGTAACEVRYKETDTDGGTAVTAVGTTSVGDYGSCWFQVGWDFTTHNTMRVRSSTDGVTWSAWGTPADTSALTKWSMPTEIRIGAGSGLESFGYIDAVKIYEDDPCTVFGDCSE